MLGKSPEVLTGDAQQSLREFATHNQVTQCDIHRQVSGAKKVSGGVSTTTKVVGSYLVKIVPLLNARRDNEATSPAALIEAENSYQVFFPKVADVQQGDRLQVGDATQSYFLEVDSTDRAKTSTTRLIVMAKEKR